jgi:hypothetical protein
VSHEVWVGQLEAGDLVFPEIDPWQFHAITAAAPVDPAPAENRHLIMATAR